MPPHTLKREILLIAIRSAALLLVLLAASLYAANLYDVYRESGTDYYNDSSCNIAVIPLQGSITSYGNQSSVEGNAVVSGDQVVSAIKKAQSNSSVKGIVLQIDSSGGYAAAGEQIMRALQNSTLPTVAYIRTYGRSAAYLAATGANAIIASNYSEAGGIGVTQSYVEHPADAQPGSHFVSISSGSFKDALNKDVAITPVQHAFFQQQVNESAQIFINEVAQNRHLATSSVEKLADGSSLLAKEALAAGLIDTIGDEGTVAQWFSNKIGEPAVLCRAGL